MVWSPFALVVPDPRRPVASVCAMGTDSLFNTRCVEYYCAKEQISQEPNSRRTNSDFFPRPPPHWGGLDPNSNNTAVTFFND